MFKLGFIIEKKVLNFIRNYLDLYSGRGSQETDIAYKIFYYEQKL